MLVIDGTAGFGKGDEWVASRCDISKAVIVLNKIDQLSKNMIAVQLNAVSKLGAAAYFPVSARTGDGVRELVDHLTKLMPEGPMYFPDDTVRDLPEAEWVAELVREQLLAVTRDELPYSIATRVTEWEWPRIRCEIIVERDSQKGMVIGKKGAVLKEVGTRVRKQLPEGVLHRAVRQGRQGLAAQTRPSRTPRVLTNLRRTLTGLPDAGPGGRRLVRGSSRSRRSRRESTRPHPRSTSPHVWRST